jgi:hypothetical protein
MNVLRRSIEITTETSHSSVRMMNGWLRLKADIGVTGYLACNDEQS